MLPFNVFFKRAFKLPACLTFFPYRSKSYLSSNTRLCVCHIIIYHEEGEKKAWWHTMTMFSPAAQRAPNKLVTVISSSINEGAGCDTLKSTHGRWRQRQGWLIKQYVHARKGTYSQTHTHTHTPSTTHPRDMTWHFPLSSSVLAQTEEGQNNPVRDYEYEMLFIESCSVD